MSRKQYAILVRPASGRVRALYQARSVGSFTTNISDAWKTTDRAAAERMIRDEVNGTVVEVGRANRSGGTRRNRAVPRPMSAREVQAARPGMDVFGAVARSSKLREWHVQAFARDHGERGFAVTLPNGKDAIVHQETAQGPLYHAWRATYFDEAGPIGHVYASGYARKSDPPGGFLGVLRRLVREDGADLRAVRFM